MGLLFNAFKECIDKTADILHGALWEVNYVEADAYFKESKDIWNKYTDSGSGSYEVADALLAAVKNNICYGDKYSNVSMNTQWLYESEDTSKNVYFPYIKCNNYSSSDEVTFTYAPYKLGNVGEYKGLAGDMEFKMCWCEDLWNAEDFYEDVGSIPSEYLQYMTFKLMVCPTEYCDNYEVIDSTERPFADYYNRSKCRLIIPEEEVTTMWDDIVKDCVERGIADASIGIRVSISKSFFLNGHSNAALIPLTSLCIYSVGDESVSKPLQIVTVQRTASTTFKNMVASNVKNYGSSTSKLDPGAAQFLTNGRVVYFTKGILDPPGPGLVPCVLEIDHLKSDGTVIRQRLTGPDTNSIYERYTTDSGSTWGDWVAITPPPTEIDISKFISSGSELGTVSGLINGSNGNFVQTGSISGLTSRYYYYYPNWYQLGGPSGSGFTKSNVTSTFPEATWIEVEVDVAEGVQNAAASAGITPTLLFNEGRAESGCSAGEYITPYSYTGGVLKYRIAVNDLTSTRIHIVTYVSIEHTNIKCVIHYDDMPTA